MCYAVKLADGSWLGATAIHPTQDPLLGASSSHIGKWRWVLAEHWVTGLRLPGFDLGFTKAISSAARFVGAPNRTCVMGFREILWPPPPGAQKIAGMTFWVCLGRDTFNFARDFGTQMANCNPFGVSACLRCSYPSAMCSGPESIRTCHHTQKSHHGCRPSPAQAWVLCTFRGPNRAPAKVSCAVFEACVRSRSTSITFLRILGILDGLALVRPVNLECFWGKILDWSWHSLGVLSGCSWNGFSSGHLAAV